MSDGRDKRINSSSSAMLKTWVAAFMMSAQVGAATVNKVRGGTHTDDRFSVETQ